MLRFTDCCHLISVFGIFTRVYATARQPRLAIEDAATRRLRYAALSIFSRYAATMAPFRHAALFDAAAKA